VKMPIESYDTAHCYYSSNGPTFGNGQLGDGAIRDIFIDSNTNKRSQSSS